MLNAPKNGNERGHRARLTAMGSRSSVPPKDSSAVELGAAKITEKLIENISRKQTPTGLQSEVKDLFTSSLAGSVKRFPNVKPQIGNGNTRRVRYDAVNCRGKNKNVVSDAEKPSDVDDGIHEAPWSRSDPALDAAAPVALVNSSTNKEAAGSSPPERNVLGAVMKTDLGELLRRSCRQRKTDTKLNDSVVSVPEELRSLADDSANETWIPAGTAGHQTGLTDWAARTTLVKKFLLSGSDNGADAVRVPVRDDMFTAASDNGGESAVGHEKPLSFGVSGVAFKRVRKRSRHFKGATYALSIHRRAGKKKKSRSGSRRMVTGLGERVPVQLSAAESAFASLESVKNKNGDKCVATGDAPKLLLSFTDASGHERSDGGVAAADSVFTKLMNFGCDVQSSSISSSMKSAAGQSLSSKNIPHFSRVALNRERPRSDFANEEREEEGDDDSCGMALDSGRKKRCVKVVGLKKSSPLDLCRLNGSGRSTRAPPMEAPEGNPQDRLARTGKKTKDSNSFTTEVMLLHRGKRKDDSWCETKLISSSSDSEGGSSKEKVRKVDGVSEVRGTPLNIPFAPPADAKHITTITVQQVEFILQGHPLCTCKTQDGGHIVHERIGSYCEGIDCIDSRLIGCVNTVSSEELLRPSVRVPFLALCEVHRQRLRFHQCCPGCGLFCTQGTFLQCRSDPRKAVHHAHKECVLLDDGRELCPHCGEGAPLQEVALELNAPRLPAFFQKQQDTVRKEPGARMAFSRGGENMSNGDPAEPGQFAKSCKISDSGKEISSAGLPVGPDRSQLEELLSSLSGERQSAAVRYTVKNVQTAAKSGDVEKILQILMMGFDPNTKFDDLQNSTVLHLSASHGHLILVHVLVQAGASLDAMDSLLQTPIMLSIDNGHTLVTQYLIKAGATLDARGEDGMTALHLAAKAGQLDICRMILDTGKVNVNILDDGGWTPLVWSAEHRHLPVVKFLLERGSDPNLRDNEHNIALHWSAFSGSLEISEIFLNHGCDLNCVNEHGDTPLHVAARQDKYECVMLLLARNANVDTLNKENETPMMCCPDSSSQSWLALSMTNHLKKITGNRTIRSEVIVHKDITRGKEQNPIQCVNRVDGETAPTDFLYIRENCETLPINIDRSIAALQSCQCEDDCSSPNCTCGTMSLKCWYDKEGKLVDEFNLSDPPMIFECNRACFCWTSCNNRVIQHGITCRLQLFRTVGKGWGVRALRDIPRGTFICEYVGELISDLEADQREDDSYLFDLDNRDGETFCIDARRYGNISRFINHSCEPNLVPVKMFVDFQDLRFPRIALFSSRAIRAHEELGFDYGDKFWIIKYKSFTCSCGTEKCKYSVDSIHDTLANYNRRLTEEVS